MSWQIKWLLISSKRGAQQPVACSTKRGKPGKSGGGVHTIAGGAKPHESPEKIVVCHGLMGL